jgi:hypothetical protein
LETMIKNRPNIKYSCDWFGGQSAKYY